VVALSCCCLANWSSTSSCLSPLHMSSSLSCDMMHVGVVAALVSLLGSVWTVCWLCLACLLHTDIVWRGASLSMLFVHSVYCRVLVVAPANEMVKVCCTSLSLLWSCCLSVLLGVWGGGVAASNWAV
jgi:hypothetical protein